MGRLSSSLLVAATSSLCWLASIQLVSAALPPGYEDVMWCPPDCCRRPVNPRPDLVGSVSLFNECYCPESDEVVDGVWTGCLSDVQAPEGWTVAPYCDTGVVPETPTDDPWCPGGPLIPESTLEPTFAEPTSEPTREMTPTTSAPAAEPLNTKDSYGFVPEPTSAPTGGEDKDGPDAATSAATRCASSSLVGGAVLLVGAVAMIRFDPSYT